MENTTNFEIIAYYPFPFVKRWKVYYFGKWVATCKYLDDAFLLVDHNYPFGNHENC